MILLPVLALAVYVAVWLWLGAQVKAWDWRLINETIWWFLATGFVLLFGATRVAEEDDFFLRTAKRALTITIFAEFFVNLVVMPFWAEFLLVPTLTFVALVQVFVEHKDEMSAVKKLADNLSALIGLCLFAFVVVSLINNPSQLAPLDGLRSLLLPVTLTLLSLPVHLLASCGLLTTVLSAGLASQTSSFWGGSPGKMDTAEKASVASVASWSF